LTAASRAQIDIGSWDTPVAARWLKEVPEALVFGDSSEKPK
jgi:hypothetical protein